jgi:hypothetical protein
MSEIIERPPLKRVMVALPCMTGTTPTAFTESLANEIVHGISQGIILYPYFLNGCSVIHMARNVLVSQFYASPLFDDMVFVDTDQAWECGELCKLVKHPVDICGGVARIKREPEEYRLNWLEQKEPGHKFTVTKDKNGLIEVDSMGACFMKISRKAVMTLIGDNPDLEYYEAGTTMGRAWDLFRPMTIDKRPYGEDITFCKFARSQGFKIYLDPEIHFAHIGPHYYEGSLGAHLKRQMEAANEK